MTWFFVICHSSRIALSSFSTVILVLFNRYYRGRKLEIRKFLYVDRPIAPKSKTYRPNKPSTIYSPSSQIEILAPTLKVDKLSISTKISLISFLGQSKFTGTWFRLKSGVECVKNCFQGTLFSTLIDFLSYKYMPTQQSLNISFLPPEAAVYKKIMAQLRNMIMISYCCLYLYAVRILPFSEGY